jgi:UDP-N-acetylglucosamine acyltransferase
MSDTDSGNTIHPTAILEGNVIIGKGNYIGPNVVMRGTIEIGDNNYIDAGTVLENNVLIGSDNYFYPYAVIGALGEMGLKGDFFNEEGAVRIGNHVTIREYVCIHSPVYRQETIIDDYAYLMNKSYVAHDCHIGKYTVLSSGVLLAGRCIVGEHVNIGLGTTVHQRKCIGDYAMVGMQSVITRDILPFATVAGNPARILRFNKKGVEHKGFESKWLEEVEKFYQSPIHTMISSDNPMLKEINLFLLKYPESLVLYK